MENIALSALTTSNYKNIASGGSLGLSKLSILIGPNGSGKSNLTAVLEFLKDSVTGTTDDDQTSSPFIGAVAKLGGARLVDKSVPFPATVNFEYRFSPTAEIPKGLILDIDLFANSKDSKVSIAREYFSNFLQPVAPEPFYYYRFHDVHAGTGVVSVYNDEYETRSHYERVDDVSTDTLGLLTINTLLESSKNPPERTAVYKVRRKVIESIKRWCFYNANYMNLSVIKNSEPKIGPSDIYVSTTGHNLSLVIDNLIQFDITFEDNLNEAMKSIIPITRRIRPVRTGLMSLNLQWYLNAKDPFYLNELSDGTVRMLCWAAILLSPNLPALLVIDEPELGIHVSWMPILAEWIKRASERTQVIICTHSPDLLDHFTDRLENVLCLGSADKVHFSAQPLSRCKLTQKLEEGWKLGDLYRVGDPILGGWPW